MTNFHFGDNEETGDRFSDTDDGPNVVKLNLPVNHREEGAAWLYVPSKDTVYIGDYGSFHIDLADTLKHVIDVKKGEKLVTGVMYPDGYIDYFQQSDRADAIMHSLQNYYSMNDPDNEDNSIRDGDVMYQDGEAYIWDEQIQDWVPEDFASNNNEDTDNDDTYYPSLKDWTEGTRSGIDDRDEIDPTTKPLGERTDEWGQEEYKDWAEQRKNEDWANSWNPRESKPHFRWSFGDRNLAPEAPHEGLFMWPVQNGYPDHFSQTGWKGLGYCAQGRVYPHVGNRYEILTWPERPRHIHDDQIKRLYKSEAQEAAKEWVIENLGADPDKIYFTEGHYGDMVSNYNSPTYPDISRTKGQSIYYDDDDGSAYYDSSPGDEYVDNKGEVSVGPDWSQQTTDLTKSMGDVGDAAKILNNVLKGRGGERPSELTEGEWYMMTPEERYEYRINKFNQEQGGHQQAITNSYKGDASGYDPLEHTMNGIPYAQWVKDQEARLTTPPAPEPNYDGMKITDRDGHVTTISQADYEQAKAEYGDNWWEKWLKPKETAVT
jgi:hypothetical protein